MHGTKKEFLKFKAVSINLKVFSLLVMFFFFTLTAKETSRTVSQININVNGGTVINTLSDHFYGHNYWMWTPSWGNNTAGTETLVSNMGVKFLRFGGTNVDVGYPDSISEAVLKEFTTYSTAINADLLFQLPLAKYNNTADRVSNASKMLTRIEAMKPVKYVSIGNEPDIYPENVATNASFNAAYLSNYTLTNYCNDYNAVASELKKNNSSLKLIGLELSWKREIWIPGFVTSCKDNIDMISLHYYPFDASQCTYNNARTQVTAINTFYTTMRTLIDKNAGGKQIPLIIGEANISWDGDPAKSTQAASPGTFNAALWFADFIGVSSAQKDLFSIMPWSIREGWTLGFLDANKKPKPVYYIYQMFAKNSKKYLIHNERVNDFVRVYGYKDDQNNVSLFAINWDTVSSYSASVKFSNILNDSTYKCEIPPHSVTCVTFSSDFKDKKVIIYSKSQSEPVPVIGSAPVISQKLSEFSFSLDKQKSVLKISSSKEVNNVTISIINLQGKMLRKINALKICSGSTFVQISQLSFPSGIYLVRLSTGDTVLSEKNMEFANVKIAQINK